MNYCFAINEEVYLLFIDLLLDIGWISLVFNIFPTLVERTYDISWSVNIGFNICGFFLINEDEILR